MWYLRLELGVGCEGIKIWEITEICSIIAMLDLFCRNFINRRHQSSKIHFVHSGVPCGPLLVWGFDVRCGNIIDYGTQLTVRIYGA